MPHAQGKKRNEMNKKRQIKIKYESTTKAIRNLGNMLILKLLELNKIIGKLKVNRLKIPNYA